MQQLNHAEIIIQIVRGSSLTKGNLYNYFCMVELSRQYIGINNGLEKEK